MDYDAQKAAYISAYVRDPPSYAEYPDADNEHLDAMYRDEIPESDPDDDDDDVISLGCLYVEDIPII